MNKKAISVETHKDWYSLAKTAVKSLGHIADSFNSMAVSLHQIKNRIEDQTEIAEERFRREYPEKAKPREALVTRRLTDEEKLRLAQGQSDEPIEDWIGPREARWVARDAERQRKAALRSAEATRGK